MKTEYTEIEEEDKRKSIRNETIKHTKNNKTFLKSVSKFNSCKNILHSILGHI